MRQNTGSHFLDSGGAYGRHFEKNQKSKIDFRQNIVLDEYGATIPIHVYMYTMFSTDSNTKLFNKVLSKDYFWTQGALEELAEKFDIDYSDYGGGNTYNSDNCLSQDFQYETFKYDGQYYIIFQLHNGCDIRGGYTSSVVFSVDDIDYFFSGWNVDFYDNETHEQFESYYDIEKNDNYELDMDKQCFINKTTKTEVYPYSSAMGF
jgi:hypothetical protein